MGKSYDLATSIAVSCRFVAASLPVTYRLYLPSDRAEDNERRCKAGIPEEIGFKTKPEIALEQMRWACETDLPGDPVVIDAGYGDDLAYVVALICGVTRG